MLLTIINCGNQNNVMCSIKMDTYRSLGQIKKLNKPQIFCQYWGKDSLINVTYTKRMKWIYLAI